MSLLQKLRDYISPPKLRNKAGGMAWLVGLAKFGEQTLNGCAVRTVDFDGKFWRIEPKLPYVLTETVIDGTGNVRYPGAVLLVGVLDENLEPWKDIGDGDRDESAAWLPPVPTVTPAKTPEVA